MEIEEGVVGAALDWFHCSLWMCSSVSIPFNLNEKKKKGEVSNVNHLEVIWSFTEQRIFLALTMPFFCSNLYVLIHSVYLSLLSQLCSDDYAHIQDISESLPTLRFPSVVKRRRRKKNPQIEINFFALSFLYHHLQHPASFSSVSILRVCVCTRTRKTVMLTLKIWRVICVNTKSLLKFN